MSSIAERNYTSRKITEEIIPACCNGNKAAQAYLNRIFYIVRLVDDFYDRDVRVEREDVLKAFFMLTAELPSNNFYKEHIDGLTAIHIIGFNAWQDANEWEQEDDELKRLYAHVNRDFICELFSMVAFLTGGRKLMKEISLRVREFFLKEIGS